MGWTSHFGVVLLVALSISGDNIPNQMCDSNDDCHPYGCCLAAFVNDENATCQSLGKSGDACDTTLSVSVPGAESKEVNAKNKYLGHCPCAEGLVCTKLYNVSHCDFYDS